MYASLAKSRSAALDLVLTLLPVVFSLFFIPFLSSTVSHQPPSLALCSLAGFQFAAEGLVPLILIAVHRERFSDYNMRSAGIGKTLVLAVLLAIAYDLLLSWSSGAWIWIPFRRHGAMRNALAAGLPLSILGAGLVVAIWGFLEAFFGVFVAQKINHLLRHCGKGWFSPGALGFGLFNGALHAAIGQGFTGFWTSFLSGYAIAVIPAVTQNAWGSGLFQTLTNAVGVF